MKNKRDASAFPAEGSSGGGPGPKRLPRRVPIWARLPTYYLLDGLHGAADLNGGGDIDVREAYAYISEKVSKVTRGRQNPKPKEPDLFDQILLGHGTVRRKR